VEVSVLLLNLAPFFMPSDFPFFLEVDFLFLISYFMKDLGSIRFIFSSIAISSASGSESEPDTASSDPPESFSIPSIS
jgi:hypothetical protein